MRQLLVLGFLAALLSPVPSQAQLTLGLRVGYAPALGDSKQDLKMKESTLEAQIPLQLDALYKVSSDIAVGAYFAYGFGRTDDTMFAPLFGFEVCGQQPGGPADGTVECSGRSIRFGAQGVYTFHQLKSPVVPWASVSFGYEMVRAEAKDNVNKATMDLDGFDLGLQVGGDYAVNRRFAFGPYLTFNVGQYQNARFDAPPAPLLSSDGSIDDKALHQWFGFGLRGKVDL